MDDKAIEAAARAISVEILGYEDEWSRYVDHSRAAIAAYRDAEIERLTAERDALQAFKDYVHQRLDAINVPTHPEGEHSKAGCRIGDRLDIVCAKLEAAERDAQRHLSSLRVRAALYAHMLTMSGGEFKEPRDFHCHARDLFQGINALPLRVTKDANEKVAERARALGVSPAGEAAIDAARGGERG